MTDNPRTYLFHLPSDRRPTFAPLEEQKHPAFEWLSVHRARSRTRDVFTCIDTVVIHATAGYATQHAVDTWKDRAASAHWIVPDEDEPEHGQFVWATVLEAKAAYHVRDSIDPSSVLGSGLNTNNRSLGIEVVNTQDVRQFSDPYSDWQVEATARIVLYAWAKYPNLQHVVAHAALDPTRRSDPGRNFPWDRFREMVLQHLVLPEPHPLLLLPHNVE